MDRIQEQLTCDGLVYRYRMDDGLPGQDATFSLCSFWMVDNLALSGRVDQARALFDKICSYANDVGLLSEQIAPEAGELRGNFPQGLTHLALIRSALHIARCEARVRKPSPKPPPIATENLWNAPGVAKAGRIEALC